MDFNYIGQAVNRFRQTGETVEIPLNVLSEKVNKCYSCGALISVETLIGGQTGQTVEQEKPCKYQLCRSCIKHLCDTIVFKTLVLTATGDDEPQRCDCRECQS